jgi:hypothetical protein
MKTQLSQDAMRLSPGLWEHGKFPSMSQYRSVLRRGRLLYSLDLVDGDTPGVLGR